MNQIIWQKNSKSNCAESNTSQVARPQSFLGGTRAKISENERSDKLFLAERSGEPKKDYCVARLSGMLLADAPPEKLSKNSVIKEIAKNQIERLEKMPSAFSWKIQKARKNEIFSLKKEIKEINEREAKHFFKRKRMVPLKPFYQIETCSNNNSHFARSIVLCSCNDFINCGVCRLKRNIRLQKHYLGPLEKMRSPKFLTLTLKSSGNLEADLKRLRKSVSKFKRSKDWKLKVRADFETIEVAENQVHMHMVIDSLFWEQKEISEQWHRITGDSFIVDIRKVKNPKQAIKEVFKYVVKDVKPEIKEAVSEFRKNNPNFRWVSSSKNLGDFDESEEICLDAGVLNEPNGEVPTSLDTLAISRHRTCPCCASELIQVGDFETKEQADEMVRHILKGNQYQHRLKLDKK
jgi:hypothetical protein